MTSNANDLTERLRRRLETERQAIDELTANELERFGENSRRVARNTLRTIEADTAVATGRMRSLLLNAWLRPLLVGLSLWLGICGGSWVTMHWLSTRIQARIQTAAALEDDWERMVAFYDFPEDHWKHLRTTNVVESPFAAVRLRTTAAKRFKRVESATALIWKLLLVAEKRFRRLDAPHLLKDVFEGRKFEDGKPVSTRRRKNAA